MEPKDLGTIDPAKIPRFAALTGNDTVSQKSERCKEFKYLFLQKGCDKILKLRYTEAGDSMKQQKNTKNNKKTLNHTENQNSSMAIFHE